MVNFQKTKDHKKRFEHFLKNARGKHGERYDYTLTKDDYTTTRDPVRIACKVCSLVFVTLPQDHVSNQPNRKGGCPDCLKTSGQLGIGIRVRWGNSVAERKITWLERAKNKHHGRYNYLNLDEEFTNEKSVITVACCKCGHTFKTRARVHISPQRYSGCAVCNDEAMREKIRTKNQERQRMNYKAKDEPVELGYIYKITNKVNGKFYIGYTTLTLKERLKAHIDAAHQIGNNGFKSISYLHHAIRKYSREVFSIEALSTHQYIAPIALAELESEAIKDLNPHYNLTKGGDMWGPVDTRAIKVEYTDPISEEVNFFPSLNDAAKAVDGKPHLLKRAAMNGEPYQGYIWRFSKTIT